jgi:dynactin 1
MLIVCPQSPTKSPTRLSVSQDNSSGQSSPRANTPATTARTSDSSAKSRLSISGRPSMGPPAAPAAKSKARPSLGTGLSKPTKSDPPTRPPRPDAWAPVMSHRQSLSTRREQSQTRSMASEETPKSPSIQEVEDDEQLLGLKVISIRREGDQKPDIPATSRSPRQDDLLEIASPHLPLNGSGSSQAKHDKAPAINKELEQMKVKYKIMERKRMEDRDKLKNLDILKAERDKFESTMQKLQRKCQAQSQEIAEWRRQLQESEAKVDQIERADAEHASEVELATLDKELAEERFEGATAELQVLKERCEELELEAEILRDENKELASGMTSEERSSAGWLQIEKENQRLRDALVALRDMTQETESSLKTHVKELEEDLADFEALKSRHEKAKSDLALSTTAVQALKENLEAADSQELVVAQLTEEKDALTEQINLLSKQAMGLREEIETSKEIQDAQDETERLLQEDLDDVRALALERDQRIKDQVTAIDNLEYTLLKFKEVANGVQSDLEELRAKNQVSEAEANELNAKSRAMMDLNLQLQSTATKAQTKKLALELNQIEAENTASHLAIIQSFVPENFKDEKGSVLALLRFRRIASKASLLRQSVEENTGHPPDIMQGDSYAALDLIQKLQWISSCCSQAHRFMIGCTAEDFSKFDAALDELEPVERIIDSFIDAAKRNDIDAARCTQELQRMIALLSDLAEKTLPTGMETFAEIITGRSEMMQLYSEVVGLQLDLLESSVRNNIAHVEEADELPHFSGKVRELVERSRTSKVVAGKLFRAVEEKKSRSMTLGETSLALFEQAESIGKEMSNFSRVLGQELLQRFNEDSAEHQSITFGRVSKMMQDSAKEWFKTSSSKAHEATSVLDVISDMLSRFHSQLEKIFTLASDLSNFSEFERHPPPWTVRARRLKEQKLVDSQLEQQLQKLKSEAQERNVTMIAKDKALEEQSLKVELLEARTKGVKDDALTLRKLGNDLKEAVAERDSAIAKLELLTKEKQILAQRYDKASAEMAAASQKAVARDPASATILVTKDESRSHQLAIDIELLKEEIANLQSAVRFLKAENHRLLHPISASSLAATNHAWLEANPLPKLVSISSGRTAAVAAEAKQVFRKLLEVSSALKPLQLQSRPDANAGGKQSSWRPTRSTPRYLVSQQREELEMWLEWKDDLVQQAHQGQRKKLATRVGRSFEKSKAPATPCGQVVDGVEIVGSPP